MRLKTVWEQEYHGWSTRSLEGREYVYHAGLATERERLASQTDSQLNDQILDGNRRLRFSGAKWRQTTVELGSCAVWPNMGQRAWGGGLVPVVAEKLVSRDDAADRLHTMTSLVDLFAVDLPLILFSRTRSHDQYRIDDGCHRAVALYLAGIAKTVAFVGEYSGPGELDW